MSSKKMPACGNMRDWLTASDDEIPETEKIIAVFGTVALVFLACAAMSAAHLMGLW